MRLDVRALAIASGAVMAVAFTLCAAIVAVSPQGFMAAAGYMTHINMSPLARTLTWGSFFAGLIAWTALAAAWGAALGWIYNRVAKPPGPSALPAERVTIAQTGPYETTRR